MDRAAFESEALSHLDAVYRHAVHLTHRASEAEELVQEVYARALRPNSVAAFQPTGGGMRSWLLAICHNVFFSSRRAIRREAGARSEEFERESAEPMPDEGPPAWDRATMNWEHVDASITAALGRLSPEYREVLLMWGVEGLKYREIAAILAVPIGTVMSRLHRARQLVSSDLVRQGFGQSAKATVQPKGSFGEPLPG
jgi:RNA polymerase sigma-70 factor (ECF subfamily)